MLPLAVSNITFSKNKISDQLATINMADGVSEGRYNNDPSKPTVETKQEITLDKEFNSDLFQYSRFNIQSPSICSSIDCEIVKPVPINTDNCNKNATKPQYDDNKYSFYYVDRHGFTQVLQADLTENNLNKDKITQQVVKQVSRPETVCESPRVKSNGSRSSSNNSSRSSLVRTNGSGQVEINTNSTNDDVPQDITFDQVRFVSIFALLCCLCFIPTGIVALIYARLMQRYYSLHDMIRAKKYLLKAEKLLMLTFFLGFSLFAVSFAILQTYLFDAYDFKIVNSSTTNTGYRLFSPH